MAKNQNVHTRGATANRIVIDLARAIISQFPSEDTHNVNPAVWENLTDDEQDRVWAVARDYGVGLTFKESAPARPLAIPSAR